MKLLTVLTLVFLLTSCGKMNGISVEGGTEAQRGIVTKALKEIPDFEVRRGVLVRFEELDVSEKGHACVDCSPCRMRLDPRTEPGLLKSLVWHELGHCYGLIHLPFKHEIMSPKNYPFPGYTSQEIDRYVGSLMMAQAKDES